MLKDYKYKIAIVICWYGKLPWYFGLFVHSVRFNPSIDIIFITDEPVKIDIPGNVIVLNKSLVELKKLAFDKLGFEVAINDPYKLCDFKPAYGFIFEEILSKYDFWGHGDCDIIYGNIRQFITDELLENFDVISARHDFLTGYFTLFRNTTKLNKLFERSKDYQKVFASNEHFCFDETNFHFAEFTERKHFSKINSEVESMTHVVKKAQEEKYIRAHFDFLVVEGAGGKLNWSKGCLIYKRKYEVLLYHLIKFKTISKSKNLPLVIPDSYAIGKDALFLNKKMLVAELK